MILRVDRIEVDVLLTALAYWRTRIDVAIPNSPASTECAGRFAQRRIKELETKLHKLFPMEPKP